MCVYFTLGVSTEPPELPRESDPLQRALKEFILVCIKALSSVNNINIESL